MNITARMTATPVAIAAQPIVEVEKLLLVMGSPDLLEYRFSVVTKSVPISYEAPAYVAKVCPFRGAVLGRFYLYPIHIFQRLKNSHRDARKNMGDARR